MHVVVPHSLTEAGQRAETTKLFYITHDSDKIHHDGVEKHHGGKSSEVLHILKECARPPAYLERLLWLISWATDACAWQFTCSRPQKGLLLGISVLESFSPCSIHCDVFQWLEGSMGAWRNLFVQSTLSRISGGHLPAPLFPVSDRGLEKQSG